VVAAVGFVGFLVIAFVGVRVVPPRLRNTWPIIAGCLALGVVTIWKVLT